MIKKRETPPLQNLSTFTPPKLINIHPSKTTAANLFKCFESERAQLISTDELGLWLDSSASQELLEYITKLYGCKSAFLPTLKSEISTKASADASLSFIGMTTTKYFKKFGAHLEGGFANRPVIVFNDAMRAPEMLPELYELTIFQKESISEFTTKIIEFFTEDFNPYIKSESFTKFKQDIQRRKIECKDNGNFNYFYLARASQNVEMIAKILHSIGCVESGSKSEQVSNDSIELAIAYYNQRVQTSIDKLLFNLTGEAKDELVDRQALRFGEKISELGMPCSKREVYRALGITKATLEDILANSGYSHNGRSILSKRLA